MKKFLSIFVLTALPLYAVLSLSSMAGMNIGFLTLLIGLLVGIFLYRSLPFQPAAGQITAELTEAFVGYRFWAIALFVACVISLIAAHYYPYAYAGRIPDVTWHGYQKSWYLICPFILLNAFRYELIAGATRAEVVFERMVRWWWYSVLVLVVVAVIQFYTGWPLVQPIPTNPGYFHAILWMGHHLSVASILIFPTFTALAIAFGAWSRNRQILKLETAAGAAGLLILFLSYARTAWIAIPIGIILLFARYLKRKQLLISLTLFIALLAGLSQTPIMKSRIENSMGIRERIMLWEANIDYFKNRPLTGIGWLKTQEMSEFYFKEKFPETWRSLFWGHAHSNFFEMLGGTGILGVLAFLGWSFFTLRLAYQTSKRARENGQYRWADFAWGLFVGLLLLQFNGLTNVTFWEGKVMHQQMLAVGMLLMLQIFITTQRPNRKGPE